MKQDRSLAIRAAVGVFIGSAVVWALFGGSADSLILLLGSSGALCLVIATKADRFRLDGADAVLFFVALLVAGAAAAAVGFRVDGSLMAGFAMAVVGLWFRRWLQPTRRELFYAAVTKRRRGSAAGVRLSPPIQPRRLLKLLAVGVGALTFSFGGAWTALIAAFARETGSAEVEHWLGPLGLTTAGITVGSWGIWMLRSTRQRPKAKVESAGRRKRRSPGEKPV